MAMPATPDTEESAAVAGDGQDPATGMGRDRYHKQGALPRSGAIPAPGQTDTGDRQRHMATHPCSGGRTARWGDPSPAQRLRRLVGGSVDRREKARSLTLAVGIWPRSRSAAVEGALIESGPHRGDHNLSVTMVYPPPRRLIYQGNSPTLSPG